MWEARRSQPAPKWYNVLTAADLVQHMTVRHIVPNVEWYAPHQGKARWWGRKNSAGSTPLSTSDAAPPVGFQQAFVV